MNQSVPSPERAPEFGRAAPNSERATQIARALWMDMEMNTIPTRVEDGDAECVLCLQPIPEGPAWMIVDLQERQYGYTGNCCYELATKHGVTRWETEHNPAGMPLVPAGLAAQFPPNVIRLHLPDRSALR